jgi:hypothetical protein
LTVESTEPLSALTVRQHDNPALGFPEDVYLLTLFPVMPGVPR